MANEMVRYHNDLNKVQLPNFNEIELDIFYALIHKIKDKNTEFITFSAKEIWDLIGGTKGRSNQESLDIAAGVFKKLSKAAFVQLLDLGEKQVLEVITLFKRGRIEFKKESLKLSQVELELNEHFEYLLNKLLGNYTEFEIGEIVNLSGKYNKLLYTHLKQYRTTGKWIIEWREFRHIMDIPKDLKPCDIDKLLKQSIKALSAEVTLFDQKRIPFKNLKYRKLTKEREPNRRKLTPYWIEFTFAPQETPKTLQDKLEGIRWTWDGVDYQVDSVTKGVGKDTGKIVVSCQFLDSNGCTKSGKLKKFMFKTYDGAKQTIELNKITA